MNPETTPAFDPAHERIDVSRDYELRDWAHRLHATPQQVSEALHAVGDRAADVALHLQGTRVPCALQHDAR